MLKFAILPALLLAGPALAQKVDVGTGDWSNIERLGAPSTLPLGVKGMTEVDKAVEAGKCAAVKRGKKIRMLLPFLIKLTGDDSADRIVIQNIQCPEVEQVAASATLAYLKARILKPGAAGFGKWYRGEVTYTLE